MQNGDQNIPGDLVEPIGCWHESLLSARRDTIVSIDEKYAFVRTERPLPPGTQVFLQIEFPDGPPLEIDATVEGSGRADGFRARFLLDDLRRFRMKERTLFLKRWNAHTEGSDPFSESTHVSRQETTVERFRDDSEEISFSTDDIESLFAEGDEAAVDSGPDSPFEEPTQPGIEGNQSVSDPGRVAPAFALGDFDIDIGDELSEAMNDVLGETPPPLVMFDEPTPEYKKHATRELPAVQSVSDEFSFDDLDNNEASEAAALSQDATLGEFDIDIAVDPPERSPTPVAVDLPDADETSFEDLQVDDVGSEAPPPIEGIDFGAPAAPEFDEPTVDSGEISTGAPPSLPADETSFADLADEVNAEEAVVEMPVSQARHEIAAAGDNAQAHDGNVDEMSFEGILDGEEYDDSASLGSFEDEPLGAFDEEQTLQSFDIDEANDDADDIEVAVDIQPAAVAEGAPPGETVPVMQAASPLETVPVMQTAPPGETVPVMQTAPPGETVPVMQTASPGETVPVMQTAPPGETVPVMQTAPPGGAYPMDEEEPVEGAPIEGAPIEGAPIESAPALTASTPAFVTAPSMAMSADAFSVESAAQPSAVSTPHGMDASDDPFTVPTDVVAIGSTHPSMGSTLPTASVEGQPQAVPPAHSPFASVPAPQPPAPPSTMSPFSATGSVPTVPPPPADEPGADEAAFGGVKTMGLGHLGNLMELEAAAGGVQLPASPPRQIPGAVPGPSADAFGGNPAPGMASMPDEAASLSSFEGQSPYGFDPMAPNLPGHPQHDQQRQKTMALSAQALSDAMAPGQPAAAPGAFSPAPTAAFYRPSSPQSSTPLNPAVANQQSLQGAGAPPNPAGGQSEMSPFRPATAPATPPPPAPTQQHGAGQPFPPQRTQTLSPFAAAAAPGQAATQAFSAGSVDDADELPVVVGASQLIDPNE